MLNDTTIRDLRELEKLVEEHYTPKSWQLNRDLWIKKYEDFEFEANVAELPWNRTICENPHSLSEDFTWISLGAKEYYFVLKTKNNESYIVMSEPAWVTPHHNWYAFYDKKTVVTKENLYEILPELSESLLKAKLNIKYGVLRDWLSRLPDQFKTLRRNLVRKCFSFLYVSGPPRRDFEHPCTHERDSKRILKFMELYYGKKTWFLINLSGGYYEKQASINRFNDSPHIEHYFKLIDWEIEFYNSTGFGMSINKNSNREWFSNDLTWWELWQTLRKINHKSLDKNWIRDILQISEKE